MAPLPHGRIGPHELLVEIEPVPEAGERVAPRNSRKALVRVRELPLLPGGRDVQLANLQIAGVALEPAAADDDVSGERDQLRDDRCESDRAEEAVRHLPDVRRDDEGGEHRQRGPEAWAAVVHGIKRAIINARAGMKIAEAIISSGLMKPERRMFEMRRVAQTIASGIA